MPFPVYVMSSREIRTYIKELKNYEAMKNGTASAEMLQIQFEDGVMYSRDHLERDLRALTEGLNKLYEYIGEATGEELELDLRNFQRELDDLPTKISDDPKLQEPLDWWRHYLETVIRELTWALSKKGHGISDAQKQVERVASEVQAYLGSVQRLEEECETAVKNNPNHEAEIRRKYRKAIDALKEKL